MTIKEEIEVLKQRISQLEAAKIIVVERPYYIPQPYPVYERPNYWPYFNQPTYQQLNTSSGNY